MRLTLILLLFVQIGCKEEINCEDIESNYFEIISKLNTKKDSLGFIEKIDGLIKKNNKCKKAYQVRGKYLIENAKYPIAKTDFLKAYLLDSSDIFTLYNLTSLLDYEEKKDSAYFYLDKAISIKTKDGVAINTNNMFHKNFDIDYDELVFYRGMVLYDLGYLNIAKFDFLYCNKFNYETGRSNAYLSSIYNLNNNPDSACYYYNKSELVYKEIFTDSIKCNTNIFPFLGSLAPAVRSVQ